MSQYVLLRKENDLLNSLIGQSFNQKSKFEAYKILKQIHKQADQYSMEKALCYIVEEGEIKGVGGSSLMKEKKTGKIVSDLILNQFGIFMSGILKGGSSQNIQVMQDSFNNPETFRIYSASVTTMFNSFNVRRMLLQVGSGTTPPARSDFNIETPFGTFPESTNFESALPIYNPALANFKNLGSITAGGSGTVNESKLRAFWINSAGQARDITLFRDIISPGQAFVASETIALEYTTQF